MSPKFENLNAFLPLLADKVLFMTRPFLECESTSSSRLEVKIRWKLGLKDAIYKI